MKKILLTALFAFQLVANPNILVFSASSREGSYNKKLAMQAAQEAKALGATVTLIDLKDYAMPFYDGDLEQKEGLPENAKRLCALMAASDAIVIATPEYNGSIPAVLKNALDWASRENPRTAFKGKTFALMSASPGGYGGARALGHLSALVKELGGTVLEKQTTVPKAYEAFNDKGVLKNGKELQAEVKAIF